MSLCDLLPAVHGHAVERANEGSEITVAAQPAEAASDLLQAGSDPADEHAAVAPAPDMADEVPDQAVEILDRVRAPQRPVQRPRDAQALQREGLVEPFAQGRRRAGVGGVEPGGELEEAALGECGVREAPGFVEHTADARPHRLGEMLEDVAPLVDVAALDDRPRPAGVTDRFAEAGAAVDHEEDRRVEIQSALAEVRQQALTDGGVLGRAFAQGEDVLLAL